MPVSEREVADRLHPEPNRIRRQVSQRDLLDVDDLSRDELDLLMETTDAMKEVLSRDVPRVPALRGRTIVTLFYEASTRTSSSWSTARSVVRCLARRLECPDATEPRRTGG